MNAIKFSHVYPKLHGQTTAELLAVRRIKIDAHTPPELLEYDTSYEGGRYPLRSGDYLQLVFIGNLHIPFCTLRSAYPASKVAYYQCSVGKVFQIETPEPPDCSRCRHFCGFRRWWQMIEEISPELFSWELYNSCGLWELDDAIYAADSFGYCDASRLRVRPKTGEYALMVTWHNGEKCWFHVDAKLLETIKRRLNRKAVQNEAHTI